MPNTTCLVCPTKAVVTRRICCFCGLHKPVFFRSMVYPKQSDFAVRGRKAASCALAPPHPPYRPRPRRKKAVSLIVLTAAAAAALAFAICFPCSCAVLYIWNNSGIDGELQDQELRGNRHEPVRFFRPRPWREETLASVFSSFGVA